MTLMPGTVTLGGAASDTQVVPAMVVFGGAGGRSNEGRAAARRPERRLGVQRRRSLGLHRRRRQRAGSRAHCIGRAGRDRGRRTDAEHRAKEGGNTSRAALRLGRVTKA